MSDKNASSWIASAKRDSAGFVLIFIVTFFAFVPISFTPLVVTNSLDPMHVFFYLTFPQFILDIKAVTDFILPAIRFGGILMGAAEGCRIMCFTTIVLFCVLKHVDNNINLLITRCKHIVQEFVFISHVLSYTRLCLLVSVTDCFLSLIIVFMMSTSIVLIVLTSYMTISLIFVVPMPLYFIFPVAAFTSQLGTAAQITFGVSWFESSNRLLAVWKHSILKVSERRYIKRKVRCLRPCRLNAKLLGSTFYFLKQPTITTFFNGAAIHTMNAVLLIPPS